MHTIRSRGFTLIELLVVIAIIGILSAVVLASLSTARSKGSDAAVQSDLSTIRTEAEIYYGGSGNNTYGVNATACTTAGSMFMVDTIIAQAVTAADNANGGSGAVTCRSNGTNFAVSAALVTKFGGTTQQYWCVDSVGKAATSSSDIPLGNYTCN